MFGQPVHRVLAEMPASEFRMWAVYRARRGLATREMHLLLARLTQAFYSVNRSKDTQAPELSEFYAPIREPDKGDSRYTAEERKTLKSLMRDK
jgi:hypothetical protein